MREKYLVVEEILNGYLVSPFNERGLPEKKRHCKNVEEIQNIVKEHFGK